MKVGIVISSNDPETVWNAFRFGNFVLTKGDEVRVFLLGTGVECESLDTDTFKVTEQLQEFLKSKGKVFACGKCLEIHQLEAPEMFTVASLKDLYGIVEESDKIVTF